jgi:hypothetical protein
MRLQTDDDVHRFQGRYVAWALFLAGFVVLFPPIYYLIGQGVVWSVIWAVLLACLVTVAVADHVDAEHPVRSWLAVLSGEWRTWRYRRAHRPARPLRLHTRKVRGLR